MPAQIHDVRFPTGISQKSSGGPERRTEIVTLSSGHEQRNTRWADSRRRYNAGYGIRSRNDLHDILAFFEQRHGRLYGFRWKDHLDFKSCPPLSQVTFSDQLIGTGDGVKNSFQLIKIYGNGPDAYERKICLAVEGSVHIAIDGTEVAHGTGFSVDTLTGVVTFSATHVPPSGAQITAGFEFDVPVRFDDDHLVVNLEAFNAGQIPDISIVELKL